mmetsp:Transcript_5459/g.16114  ORF Transcript_5459/g.16114 Transcript_5459/m.16114 type:complete len:251 (-) Transcript_5459:1235-1987(-)
MLQRHLGGLDLRRCLGGAVCTAMPSHLARVVVAGAFLNQRHQDGIQVLFDIGFGEAQEHGRGPDPVEAPVDADAVLHDGVVHAQGAAECRKPAHRLFADHVGRCQLPPHRGLVHRVSVQHETGHGLLQMQRVLEVVDGRLQSSLLTWRQSRRCQIPRDLQQQPVAVAFVLHALPHHLEELARADRHGPDRSQGGTNQRLHDGGIEIVEEAQSVASMERPESLLVPGPHVEERQSEVLVPVAQWRNPGQVR